MDASASEGELGTASESNCSESEQEGNLRDELQNALKDAESTFSGSFYHCSTDPNAPNPGLHIDGLGVVGLPLNQREAQLIISRSAQAPFGKGAETVVDTKVRDTWEIDPGALTFLNPRWQNFIDQLASKTVWSSLGVAPYKTKPRCELYKLLVYQEGSHFLPHQDTAKAPGMFATIVVVLPSAFQGGEVHVSHAGVNKVLDVSQASRYETSILAWYTDVIHEVKPITAGYRLALSYNLIHTSPNVPAPSLPEQVDVTSLRQCLEKWNENGFETVPDTPLIAYLLAHQYSEDDLDNGHECLKGKDANTVSRLLHLAESVDIVVCLGNLTRTVSGYADDDGYQYHRRGRWYGDEFGSGQKSNRMGEVEADEYEITKMVRIDEGDDDEVDFGTFTIEDDCLIPKDPFRGAKPAGEDYEGYLGNGAGSLSQWYHSSVIVLIRKGDVMCTGISLNGHKWGLQRLRLSPNPNPEAKQVVWDVVKYLEDSTQSTHASQGSIQENQQNARAVLRHAVVWKHPELWNRIIKHCGPGLEAANTHISEAVDVFKVESIKSGFAQLINQNKALQARFDVIKVIATKVGASHSGIVEELSKGALSSYRAAEVADVPILVDIAKKRGLSVIEADVLPRIARAGTYDFLIALAKALWECSTALGEAPSCCHLTRDGLRKATRQCIKAAIPQWEVTTTAPGRGEAIAQAKTNRLPDLLELCLSIDDSDLCKKLATVSSETGDYDSRLAFAKAFHGHFTNIPEGGEQVQRKEDFKKAIRKCLTAAIASWQSSTAAAGYSDWTVSGQVARVRDLLPFCFTVKQPSLCVTFFNAVQQTAPYEVMMELMKTLRSQMRKIKGSATDEAGTKVISNLHKVVRLSLESAIVKWEVGVSTPLAYRSTYGATASLPVSTAPNAKVNRICELVDACFSLKATVQCVTLFNTLLHPLQGANPETRFNEILIPLVPHLKTTIAKNGKTIELEPFASFLRYAISLYLSRILAPRTPSPLPATFITRNVGCATCHECQSLSTFLNSSGRTEINFKAAQSIRSHLEQEMHRAHIGDLVTTETIKRGSPHTLVVTKRPQIVQQLLWKKMQGDAVAFVRSIGDDGEVKGLWPERHNDIMKAIQGTKPFIAPVTLKIPTTVVTARSAPVASSAKLEAPVIPMPAGPPAGTSSSATRSTAHGTAPALALQGTKRKHRGPTRPP